MAVRTINILGLCSGLWWLEFAVCDALGARGIRAECVCHCEREAVTAALLARLGNASGCHAPIWDDIATFDGSAWRGVVDCVVAGLPCPAFSVAGKHGGNDDERAWGQDGDSGPQHHFLRIVGECQPGFLWLENVPPFVSGGHFRRLGDGLLGLGYRIAPAVFLYAGAVGATQKRERVYVLAYREDSDGWRQLVQGWAAARRWAGLGGIREELGECAGGGCGIVGGTPGHAGHAEQSIEDVGRFPPGYGHWTDPEWLRALAVDSAGAPAVEPGFSVVVDGLAVAGSDLLRIGGNGVVPLAAALAFCAAVDGEIGDRDES